MNDIGDDLTTLTATIEVTVLNDLMALAKNTKEDIGTLVNRALKEYISLEQDVNSMTDFYTHGLG